MKLFFMAFLLIAMVGCGSQGTSGADEVLPPEAVDDNISDNIDDNNSSTFPGPSDPNFITLPDGTKLSDIKVSGSRLSLSKGSGKTFGSPQREAYLKLRRDSETQPGHLVQWVLMDLDDHKVLGKSLDSDRRIFGASSSKIYVAAALLDLKNGVISASQKQLMADMLVVSSNEAWVNLQKQIGDGSPDKGRERIYQFTQRMGYLETRGFQGSWGAMHGNELVATEVAETLYDMYRGAFPGAEVVWKLMHTCRTGANRGRKYIPSNVYVGGKTGTYDGTTVHPYNGGSYTVHIRNHVMVFSVDGKQFGLVVLANSGSDESAALLAGGLIRDFTRID